MYKRQAYERSGGTYYPKLISAIPFTPVNGPRFLYELAIFNKELSSTEVEEIFNRGKALDIRDHSCYYGNELIVNGDFSEALSSGWLVHNATGIGQWGLSSGKVVCSLNLI
mgnify:CR=1 FL=1